MSLLSPDDVRPFLRMNTQAPSVEDEVLQEYIDAAETAIATHPDHGVGPLEPTLVTETLDAVGGVVVLGRSPVIAVTAVTLDGTAVGVDTVKIRDGLLVQATSTGTPLSGTFEVTYLAGHEVVPANVRLALRELVRHLLGSYRGSNAALGGGTPGQAAQQAPTPGALRALPPRVTELLAGASLPGGFA